MGKYSTALNAPFTIAQMADVYKTAFDTLGWGTGKVSIQGGYRFTAQQAADTAISPIQVKPDNTVVAPGSIPNLSTVIWVDNYCGKNLVYPLIDTYHRWPLLFYLPGMQAFRLKFTPVYRPQGGTTGNFSDLAFHVAESPFTANPTNISNQGRLASLSDGAWGSTYTVGTQYTTKWSHGAGGAFSNNAQAATLALIYCQNVVLRIDAIEYLVDENVFGVQSPNLDGGVFEFRFQDGSGAAYGIMRPYPVKNAYQPRVLLSPPLFTADTGLGSPTPWYFVRLTNWLFNLYREDNLQDTGLANGTLPTFAVSKNYSYGSTLNIFLASNTNFRGFFLRSTQPGKPDIHLSSDKADLSVLPASSLTIPERRERAQLLSSLSRDTSSSRAPLRTGFLLKVEGQNRTLVGLGVDNLWAPSSTAYAFKLYNVSLASGSLLYQSKVADLTLTGDGNSGYGTASVSGLSLSLAPGYYLLVPPGNLPARANYASPECLNPITSAVRFLGPVACRDLASDSGWVAGSTALNLGSDNSLIANNAAIHGHLGLWLDFENMDTPSSSLSSFAEGTMFIAPSPLQGNTYGLNWNTDYDLLATANGAPSAQGNWCYGAYPPFGISRALSSVEPGYLWQLSPLPGWFSGQRSSSGQDALLNPTVEFVSDLASPFKAYLDRPYRFSLPSQSLVIRSGATIAPGNSYVNGDGSEDIVFSTHVYQGVDAYRRSVCFRVT